jgi:uncharacterized C2H2 Zn-finger protein/DNA-directed RNA polymerase subunit RPC12/RpoP
MYRLLTGGPVEQHWPNSPSHVWCHRCDMLFKTEQDLNTHRENSMSHWLCHKCSLDFSSQEGLHEHYSDADHNWCYICERDFDTPSNLHQHELTHLPRNKACPSCGGNRWFATYAAMFIHLENGCSTTIAEVNRLARMCYQSKHYVEPEYNHYLMHDNTPPWPPAFRCPGCERTFSRLSSLVQHVESHSCTEGIFHGSGAIGKMIRFLSSRV